MKIVKTILFCVLIYCSCFNIYGQNPQLDVSMSMLGMSLLKEIVIKECNTQPDVILERLRKEIIIALGQTGVSGEQNTSGYLSVKDGMDIALCAINMTPTVPAGRYPLKGTLFHPL